MAWKSRIINLLLSRLSPSGTALLGWLGPQINDSMLWEIAAADYGYKDSEYFQSLKPIRDHQRIPVPLTWLPKEVLELKRWSEPEDQTWKPGSIGPRGHLIRAFCCGVLLKAADEPETQNYIDGENETLIQMTGSVLYLGHEATENALRLLSWRILRLSVLDEEYPFFALGLLLLSAALFKPGQDGSDLKLLAEWVILEETRTRKGPMALSASENWLLDLTYFNQKHEAWRRLSHQVLTDPTKGFPPPAASAMQAIINALIRGQASCGPTRHCSLYLPQPSQELEGRIVWRLPRSEMCR